MPRSSSPRILILGSATPGEVVTAGFRHPSLPGGDHSVNYTVLSDDTLATIARKIADAINSDSVFRSRSISASASNNVVTLSGLETFGKRG